MKKACITITAALLLIGGIVYATDGALFAVKRSSTGVLEAGFDSGGNVVAANIPSAGLTAVVALSNVTHFIIVSGIVTDTSPTSIE